MKKKTTKKKAAASKRAIDAAVKKGIQKEKMDAHDKKNRMYRFGFWLFFALALFSVMFSVWAITSIYSNFQVVTKILDQSFERTNLVFDITSSKISSCQNQLMQCRSENVLPNGNSTS